MNPALQDFAQSMFARFEQAGIPLLLAGGWAVSAHGFPRNTLDIDWVCSRSLETETRTLMKQLGFEPRSDGMATRFQYSRELTFPFVDLLWVSEETFDKLRGEIDPVLGVRVVSFEGLIAMKLHALRDHQQRKGRDLRDLQELLERNPGKISEHALRQMCRKYAGENAYDRLVSPS